MERTKDCEHLLETLASSAINKLHDLLEDGDMVKQLLDRYDRIVERFNVDDLR
jgi:hypothetical protein